MDRKKLQLREQQRFVHLGGIALISAILKDRAFQNHKKLNKQVNNPPQSGLSDA